MAEVARTMGEALTENAGDIHTEIADAIPELRGDPMMIELLRASVESNVETMLHSAQHALDVNAIVPPTAAVAYAQRLAQRGTSSNALIRAYRLGQRRFIEIAFDEVRVQESDPDVAFAAAQEIHALASTYIDVVAERVVAEYEIERERWLANRNTVRAATLNSLLSGENVDVIAGESALGYRLRQSHLAVVAWDAEAGGSASTLRQLESLVAGIGEAIGGAGPPLFIPQDRALAWGWIPLRAVAETDVAAIDKVVLGAGGDLRIATGTAGSALSGFRNTHLEAIRAHTVATIAGDLADRVTTYATPGVRAASLLTGDLASARALVSNALGGLAADDEASARLRETLLAFLSEGSSFLATSKLIHVHKNTVKYRVDKAVEIRGRPLDDDRFNLELALIACRWLGRSVLTG
jgi:DNA-binding PucR family transcriptional regulator